MWHYAGDSNTKFTMLKKTKRSRHRIIRLQNEEGQWITYEVGGGVGIPTSIISQIKTRLTAVATEEEVRQVLFMMISKSSKFR